MKTVVLVEPYHFEVQERPAPEPGPGEALLRVRVVGICGSDLHAYHGSQPFLIYPRVLGHELSAEIVALGPEFPADRGLAVGDRVCVDLVINCGTCYPCRVGRPNCCVNIKVMGVHVDGGMAEMLTAPADRLYKVPDSIGDEEAALVEPLTIGCQAVARGDVASGETVAVLGAGPIGLVSLLAAKARGARVLISDLLDSRLDLARSLGAEVAVNSSRDDLGKAVADFTSGEGANVVIEAVGIPATVYAALDVVSAAGRVVLLGLGSKPVEIVPTALIRKELDIRASRMNSRRFPEAIDLIARARLPLGELITHRMLLASAADAFELLVRKPDEACKVILLPG